MKICHFVGHSLVRYTPGRIATYWGRYTEHEARAFALRRGGGWQFQEPLNPYGFQCPKAHGKGPLRDWIEAADVLHFHDDSYPTVLEGWKYDLRQKVKIYHAHIGNIPDRFFNPRGHRLKWRRDIAYAGITNGYGHLFNEDEKKNPGRTWGRLPDILDLDHPVYRQDPALYPDPNAEKLRVVYTYSNGREDGKINAKRPKAHAKIFQTIPGVEYVAVCGRPFEEAQAIKASAHVVLEECFTPYLHLSALEGAAMGKPVVTSFDSSTIMETSDAVGAPHGEWPFIKADSKSLRSVIEKLRDDRSLLALVGDRALRWMETYYTAPALLKKYEEFYARAREAQGL